VDNYHPVATITLAHHMMISTVTFTQPGPDPGLVATIEPLYTEVYAEPPYHEGPTEVQEFIDRWNYHVRQPGFRIVLAHRAGRLVGFCFGFPLGAQSRWWDGLLDPVDASVIAEDGHRSFAIIELAVHAEHRRNGLGRVLHDTLLDSCARPRATLLTRPEAAPALAAYASWGYQAVGRLRPGPNAPLYVAMTHNLA
jgi:GNAT superfamily N-acetyltransferase